MTLKWDHINVWGSKLKSQLNHNFKKCAPQDLKNHTEASSGYKGAQFPPPGAYARNIYIFIKVVYIYRFRFINL